MTSIWNSRTWIVIEPVILLLVLGLLAREFFALVDGDPGAAAEALAQSPPNWAALAFLEGRSHLVKWGLLLLAAALLARARGFRLNRPLGRGASPLPFWQLLLFGLAIAIPLQLFSILPRWYHFTMAPLGDTPAIWNLIYGSEWTAGFWIFMAISSFAVVPVVEELFFRGYVLGSLGQRVPPFWAIVLSALIFRDCSHAIYTARWLCPIQPGFGFSGRRRLCLVCLCDQITDPGAGQSRVQQPPAAARMGPVRERAADPGRDGADLAAAEIDGACE